MKEETYLIENRAHSDILWAHCFLFSHSILCVYTSHVHTIISFVWRGFIRLFVYFVSFNSVAPADFIFFFSFFFFFSQPRFSFHVSIYRWYQQPRNKKKRFPVSNNFALVYLNDTLRQLKKKMTNWKAETEETQNKRREEKRKKMETNPKTHCE